MKKFIIGGLLTVPSLSFAALAGSGTVNGPLGDLLNSISNLINYMLPFLISIAVLLFFWGVVKYIANAGNEEARAEGKTFMIWGLIAVVVMVSFWGLVGFIQNSLTSAGGDGSVVVSTAPSGISTMLPG